MRWDAASSRTDLKAEKVARNTKESVKIKHGRSILSTNKSSVFWRPKIIDFCLLPLAYVLRPDIPPSPLDKVTLERSIRVADLARGCHVSIRERLSKVKRPRLFKLVRQALHATVALMGSNQGSTCLEKGPSRSCVSVQKVLCIHEQKDSSRDKRASFCEN